MIPHLLIRTPTAKNDRTRPVNPFGLGGGFLSYCIKKGWLTEEGKGRSAKYYVTEEGKKETAKFGISA